MRISPFLSKLKSLLNTLFFPKTNYENYICFKFLFTLWTFALFLCTALVVGTLSFTFLLVDFWIGIIDFYIKIQYDKYKFLVNIDKNKGIAL